MTLADRSEWIANLEIKLESNGSGIRWIERDTQLQCQKDNYLQYRVFSIDRVIPYSYVFDTTFDGAFLDCNDANGETFQVKVPRRIWTALSKKIYSLVKPKIPQTLRRFWQSNEKWDGVTLIRTIRSVTDNLGKSSIEILEHRRDTLKLDSLGDWLTFRGEFLQLQSDWTQAISDGKVDVSDNFNLRQIRRFISDKCDGVLPGIDEWLNTAANSNRRLEDILEHCDVLCTSKTKALARNKKSPSPIPQAYLIPISKIW